MKCDICEKEIEGSTVITMYGGAHCDSPECHQVADDRYNEAIKKAEALDINNMPDEFSLEDFEMLSLSIALDLCKGIREVAEDATEKNYQACRDIVDKAPYVLIPANMALEVKKAVVEKLRDWVTVTNYSGWRKFMADGQFVWDQPVPKRVVLNAFYQCDFIDYKQTTIEDN